MEKIKVVVLVIILGVGIGIYFIYESGNENPIALSESTFPGMPEDRPQYEKEIRIHAIGWNGDYWLITSISVGKRGVVKYNGDSFEDIPLFSYYGANALEWNGEYWLVGIKNEIKNLMD